MNKMEMYIQSVIEAAAHRAHRASRGAVEYEDIVQDLWLKVLPLRSDRKKWTRNYLAVVIWKNALNPRQRTQMPIPLITEEQSSQCVMPEEDIQDLFDLIIEVNHPGTRHALLMYYSGFSVKDITKYLGITPDVLNSRLTNGKRVLRTALKKLPKLDREALRNAI